ncbi:MAG: glycine zipper 2TM domain-containing protein, partial [Propionivibrio sp.]|nr:glycine zipper 2TM domain-containing protein [Propionivibrio sp.]
MKTRFGIILSLSLGLLSANAAQANDAVLGAILGGGLGAVVGNHVGGRDGAAIGGAVGAAAGVVIATDDDHG